MKTNVSIKYGNVWFPVSASMPQDTNSLVKFLDAMAGNGETVRNLLVDNNGIYQIDVCQRGLTTTTERRIFMEKSFVEGRENCTRCTIFVFYPNQTAVGAAFLVSPSQPTGDGQITTSQIEVKTTQDIYGKYQSAKKAFQLGIAGTAFFGIVGPVLIGPFADLPVAAGLIAAGAGGGTMLAQKIRTAHSKQIIVPDQRTRSLTALMQTSPNLAAVQNAIGTVVKKSSDELCVYGFPIEQGRRDISVIIPESVTDMKIPENKLLVWIGGEISQDGKRALEAMSRDSELLFQSGKRKDMPAVRFVFPEVITGISNSYFIDASRVF